LLIAGLAMSAAGCNGTGLVEEPSGGGRVSVTRSLGDPVGGISGSSGNGSTASPACKPGSAIPQRIVRLSFDQLGATMGALLGQTALDALQLEAPKKRVFQALYQEGDLIDTQILQKTSRMAEHAAGVLSESNFAGVTGCAQINDDCAKTFLQKLAEKAYRRPLTADELSSVTQLYDDELGAGADTVTATRLSMQGVMMSPAAIYRTELGKSGGMSDYEAASQLSYFLSNGPPDSELLAAARDGKLSTPEELGAQVDRLLATPAVTKNLTQAMLSYFQVGGLDDVVKDPMLFPDFTSGMKSSMYEETKRFIESTLWAGPIGDLLTSRKTQLDANLAKLYGLTVPGATAAGTFAPYELAAGQRSGILTQASLLSLTSNPERTSVVHRGLFINATVLCSQSPPPPTSKDVKDKIDMMLADKTSTERQKSMARTTTQPCSSCHSNFDAYGLLLERYDAIGRWRDQYMTGQAIETSVELPAMAGGGMVPDVTSFAEQVVQNGAFTHCLTANLMKYAAADPTLVGFQDCAVDEVHDALRAGDQTFASLIKQIAISKTLSVRGGGP
jgi:hypothetical protein